MTSVRIMIIIILGVVLLSTAPEKHDQPTALDKKVQKFLEAHRHDWYDLNVPYQDGQLLYDLIVEHQYTRALEIGTSTGHSGIWIAWALSKTGGKLITLEIDEDRRQQALQNFKETGLEAYVDSRLGDAHELVKQLEGPFDFVFSDADKGWYKQYFIDIAPKMTGGGCFTAHNITMRMRGIREFVDYIKSRKDFKTTIETTRSTGISISYKLDEN